MARTRPRYEVVRVADLTDDQKTAAQILAALASSVTQEDLQEYVLSQVKRIIHGNHAGHWYDDFVTSGILSLQDVTASLNSFVVGQGLSGALDGVNRTFLTPEKFVHIPARQTIEVFHNGRRLRQALAPNVVLGDYYVSESGGSGTGFDSVNMLSFTPRLTSVLLANYQSA